jgi:predicted transcriptional regulator
MVSLSDDVATDQRTALEAIRNRLASELEEAGGRDVASIARELRLTLADIENLPSKREESKVDDLTARREQRRRAANQ